MCVDRKNNTFNEPNTITIFTVVFRTICDGTPSRIHNKSSSIAAVNSTNGS